MMTVHSLHAGDGYTYLTREVASGDVRMERGQELADYYTVEGTPPGVWGGRAAAALEVSGTVREDQMKALFGEGMHPEAEERAREMIAEGATAKQAIEAQRLGRRFASFRNEVPFLLRVNAAYEGDRQALGRPLNDDERTQIRYRIAADQFHRELGRSPANEGEIVRYMAAQKRRERQPVAGYDCVFTPQKSVSVLWALGGSEVRQAVEDAHRQAVDDALKWVEDNASFTRVGSAGVAQIETNGLIYARFDHRDNRNGDPNLHTHTAISTKVQGVDGKWRSLDGRVLHKLAVAASERYNTAVMQNLERSLGVRFKARPQTAIGKRPVLEIDGVPTELLAEFSRRDAIERRLKELIAEYRARHGKDPSKAMQLRLADQATLDTREGKAPPRSLADQVAEWERRASNRVGQSTVKKMLRDVVGHKSRAMTASEIDTRILAAKVIETVSLERTSWNRWHVAAEAQRQLREYHFASTDELDRAAEQVAKAALAEHSIRLTAVRDEAPAVLRRSNGESVLTVHGNETYTSDAVLAMEARIVRASHTLTATIAPEQAFHAALHAQARIDGHPLNAGQEALARHFISSGMLVSAGIGPAGTGKTTAMKVVAKTWKATGHDVIALGPSAVAAGVLGEELESVGRTIADVLTRHEHGLDTGITSGALVLVDEAGMASTRDLDRLIAIAAEHGAVVRLLGDPQQLAAVESGGALRLVANETNAPELTEIHRFRTAEEADISLRLRSGDTSVAAWYAAKDRITTGMADDLIDKIFEAWQTDTGAGKKSLMVAATNATVTELNDRARADRYARGLLHGRATTLSDGLEASAGDRIVTRLNDSKLRVEGARNERVRNGDLWTVEKVHRDGALDVKHLEHGGRITLPAGYVAAACQLGYATTVNRCQGMTVDSTHGILDESMTRQAAYVMLSRGRDYNNLYIATDRIVDLDLDHPHPDRKIADEVLRGVIARDGSDLSATEQQREAAVANLKLDRNVPGYGYANDLLDAGRFEALAREHLGDRMANQMIEEDAWEAFVRQAQRAESIGLDVGPLLRETASERELGSAQSISEVMHWRLEPKIVDGIQEADAWADHLKPALRDAFGRHAETLLDDTQGWSDLAVRLRQIDRTGVDAERVIDDLRDNADTPEPTTRELIEIGEQLFPIGREPRNPAAPSWVAPPLLDREGMDHELIAWSHQRYVEIADRTRDLGRRAVEEQPAWTAHLGELPESGIARARWIAAAAQAAAYREQFGVTTDRSLLGDRPEHGDAAHAYAHISAQVRELNGESVAVPTGPGDLADRAALQQEQWRHDQQLAECRAEQRRLDEARRAERREQIRRQQQHGPKRHGPTL
ncbi:relaxase domain-containing protein [Rhodococcus hoagii]|nr:relaxase domain-containing protein [Prescottella equi]NKR30237.1 relaxase domain-containing protein [Prescottella equi]